MSGTVTDEQHNKRIGTGQLPGLLNSGFGLLFGKYTFLKYEVGTKKNTGLLFDSMGHNVGEKRGKTSI